jgi:hypothetical protein
MITCQTKNKKSKQKIQTKNPNKKSKQKNKNNYGEVLRTATYCCPSSGEKGPAV